MLGTLYGRALESRSAHPILRDPHAKRVVGMIDYDFRKLGVQGVVVTSIALRARPFDSWTAAFLARHPQATVLHLGCGLDSRAERLDPAPGVAWFDVDYPEVIELRRRSSATSTPWSRWSTKPARRPARAAGVNWAGCWRL
jgi:O-methyltransferase involved in polyketide biosynthesis